MKKQFDIGPARKRAGVFQREIEADLGLPNVSMSAIEDGRIGIDDETYGRIHDAINRIGARKKGESEECEASTLVGSSPAT